MSELRKIEIFSAACPLCEDTIALVNRMACPSCEISVLDMNDPDVAKRARDIGVQSVPAVAVDGELAPCCTGRGVSEVDLRSVGVGQPLA